MHLLRRPRLALLFAGGALNAIGSWTSLIAVWGFAAYRFHSGPSQVALLGLAWTAPGALFSLTSGWPIDRFGPKATVIGSNIVGMTTALAMAAVGSYDALVGLTVLSGVVMAFGEPAANSLPPRIVDDADLLAANSLMGMAEQSAIVFGPLVASATISWSGVRAAFIVDAVTFVAGSLAVLPLRLRPLSTPVGPERVTTERAAALRLVWHIREVRRTLVMALFVFSSWGAYLVLEPLYVRDVLHRSPATLGYLQSAFGIGLIAMTALLPRLGDRVVSVRALALAVMASGASAALYVGTHHLAVAVAGVFLWGVVTGFFLPPMRTLLQRATPTETHGRVMATAGFVNGLAGLVVIPLTGVAVGAEGVAEVGIGAGSILFAVGLAGAVGWSPPPAQPVATGGRSLSRAAAKAG